MKLCSICANDHTEDQSGKTIVFRIGENNYRIIERGKEEYKYSDVAPVIPNGRTLLPLRALSESSDFQVDWKEQERKVEIKGKKNYCRKLLLESQWENYLKTEVNREAQNKKTAHSLIFSYVNVLPVFADAP